MDKELKDDSTVIYSQKRLEAQGRIAVLQKLRADKLLEQAAEIQSIDANIIYYQNQQAAAEKFLIKLSAEVVA